MAKGFLHIRKYGLVYARVPKVANSSIKNRLVQLVTVTPQAGLKPTHDRFWQKCTEDAHFMSPLWYTMLYERKFSFSFIRDPLDRLFSCYVNKIVVDKVAGGFKDRGYGIEMSFDDFVAHTCAMRVSAMDVHTQPQAYLISDLRGRLPKFIGIFERMEHDWNRLATELEQRGITIAKKLPMLNNRKQAQQLISRRLGNDTKRIFYDKYAADISLYDQMLKRNSISDYG